MKPWMQKAEHALATGQPHLAALYMRRGLNEHPDGRAWLERRDADQAQREAMQALFGVGRQLVEAYAAFGRALLDAYTPLFDLVRAADQGSQADFALVPGGRK